MPQLWGDHDTSLETAIRGFSAANSIEIPRALQGMFDPWTCGPVESCSAPLTHSRSNQSMSSSCDWIHRLECPANSVPVGVRQTGMEGAWNGEGQEAHA